MSKDKLTPQALDARSHIQRLIKMEEFLFLLDHPSGSDLEEFHLIKSELDGYLDLLHSRNRPSTKPNESDALQASQENFPDNGFTQDI